MRISDIAKLAHTKILQDDFINSEIEGVYTSDLLSDVLANAKPNSVLITIQAHKNTIAVATQKKLPAIIFCNNRAIQNDTIELAKREKIALFSTEKNQYETSCEIYKLTTL